MWNFYYYQSATISLRELLLLCNLHLLCAYNFSLKNDGTIDMYEKFHKFVMWARFKYVLKLKVTFISFSIIIVFF